MQKSLRSMVKTYGVYPPLQIPGNTRKMLVIPCHPTIGVTGTALNPPQLLGSQRICWISKSSSSAPRSKLASASWNRASWNVLKLANFLTPQEVYFLGMPLIAGSSTKICRHIKPPDHARNISQCCRLQIHVQFLFKDLLLLLQG